MKYPNIMNADHLIRTGNEVMAEIDGKWVAARPLGFASFINRFLLAWMVFTGKADVVVWTGQ
jgi:hypothetical protein